MNTRPSRPLPALRPVKEQVVGEHAGHTDERILAFIDCHFVAALAAAGMMEAAREMAEGMAGAGGVFAHVGAPVARALIAHRAEDYAEAARLLRDVCEKIVTMGGSHAQRDLFELVLKDAETRV